MVITEGNAMVHLVFSGGPLESFFDRHLRFELHDVYKLISFRNSFEFAIKRNHWTNLDNLIGREELARRQTNSANLDLIGKNWPAYT